MKQIHLSIFLALGMIFYSCTSTNSSNSNPPQSDFPLVNSTFDSSGHPSLDGWLHDNSDVDSTATFLQDAPPGLGGTWSIALIPGWVPFRESVERSFTGLSSGVYQLTAWTKIRNLNNFVLAGQIGITKISGGKSDAKTLTTGDSTAWHPLTLLDTLTLQSTDTVQIKLDGGTCEVCAIDSVLYNNITFKKLP